MNHIHFLELLFHKFTFMSTRVLKNLAKCCSNKLYNVEISSKEITTNKKIVAIFKNLETICFKVHVSGKFTTEIMKKGLILNESPD